MANLSGFERRKRRSRYQLKRCAKGRLRLSVFRSGKHMYAQIIDDAQRVTLVSASTLERDLRPAMGKSADCAAAAVVGKILAERAQKSGVNQVVFDRGAYVYHGRVKALADAARGAGLQF